MKNNDYQFIKEKFDNDGVSAPEINAMGLIDGKSQIKARKNKNVLKPIISAAACLMILATTAYVVSPLGQSRVVSNGILTFSSYDEIESQLTAQQKLESIRNFGYGAVTYKGSMEINESATMDADTNAGSMSSSSNSHGTTNIQEEGVDEADIIKNDGKYIYYATNAKVLIYEGTKKVATIKMPNQEYANDMYVDGNELVLITSKSVFPSQPEGNTEDIAVDVAYSVDCMVLETDSCAYVYDISNIKNPKLKYSYSQNGGYVTSRKIGDKLYIISDKHFYNPSDCVVYSQCNGKKSQVSPKDISYTKNMIENCYTVVAGYDISTGKQIGRTKAMLGYTGETYCSQDNLYITSYNYNNNTTNIVKINLNASGIKVAEKGTAKGMVNNQFSMDEADGIFRIATTTEDNNNYIYTLDKNLNQIGVTNPFGKDESIRATYYMGDYAYAITYEQTDPLFVIDLKDPKAPTIKGSVKISGFSTQLVPVSEDRLLGIGYSDDSSVKVVLFDISNPEKPAVVDSTEMEDCQSNAQYTHKAIVTNKEANYYAIDYYHYGDEAHTGAATIVANQDGVRIDNYYKIKMRPDYYTSASRCTYIGDKLYVLDDEGRITEFTVK